MNDIWKTYMAKIMMKASLAAQCGQILDACSAHRKKPIVGLDEFIANGREVSYC